MTITSVSFLLFVFALLIVYYVLPKRTQWIVLLVASISFYLMCSLKGIPYILFTATSIYFATRWMESLSRKQKAYIKENKPNLSKEEMSDYKRTIAKSRKRIMVCTLILNIAILCSFKYINFFLDQISLLISVFNTTSSISQVNWVAPLGISFYTFQSIGYLVDVYWGTCPAEKNYFKNLLFVSFFPQITQGPISDHEALSGELFKSHTFTYENFSRGFQRMLWGLMKKMIVANILAPYVQDVFTNYASYKGVTVFIGALFYSVQIYADFSGYMDIMCGTCEMLDINLTENFNRPYFSKSIAEYWRRWHISLGEWFKKYIYYPIAVAKWNRKLGTNAQKKMGKHFGQTLPATIALIVVWLTTGFWHGASWSYIAWGGVNGLFIIFSLWMEPVFEKSKAALRINESKWLWRAFQTIRTFLLVTLIKVLPEVGTLSDGLGFIKRIFTNFEIPKSLGELLPFLDATHKLIVVIFFAGLLFVSSLLQRKKPIRDYFNKIPAPIRIVLLAVLFVCIVIFGIPATKLTGGFMYAQF